MNRKSTTAFPMNLRLTSCVVTNSSKGAQKRNVTVFRFNNHMR